MISFELASQKVISSAEQFGREFVPLSAALGRVLYQDIYSDIDIPPFNKSAMDGYACRFVDIDKPLKIIETIPAGYPPQKKIRENECANIMTGGVIPEGADCVVMVEHTEKEDNIVKITKKSTRDNICQKGEDVKENQLVLSGGTLVTPSEVAILASVGCDPVPVTRKPIVGVIATGSEIVEPSQKPSSAQIRNSNSYQLCSQITQVGGIPEYLGIVEDSEDSLKSSIEDGLKHVDVLLLSGGVSMGDYDYVPKVLEDLGIKLDFRKVAIKPGKPTTFGKKGNKYVFGLPGNPVSTFAIFEILVRPFLMKLMGANYQKPKILVKMKKEIIRKNAERMEFLPIFIDQSGDAVPIDYHGSAHIHAFGSANAIFAIPVGIKKINEGEMVSAILIK